MNEPDQSRMWKAFSEASKMAASNVPANCWRVGRSVPLNVYEGDRPICQCHTAVDARRIVEAMNRGEQDETKTEKFPLTEGWYWVWHDNEWKPGHWDGEDWNIQGIITSRILPRGPGWIVPPKPTEPPEIPDAGMSSARRVPGGEQDETKNLSESYPNGGES